MNGTPALVALYGRVYDPTSIGALAMWKLSGVGAALVAILAIVTVVRHTRSEEETGRLELVGSTVVGRHATLAAGVLVAVLTNLVLALLTAAALSAGGLPARGAIAFGLAWGATGLAFAGVAAIAAQLTRTARTATGMSMAVLAATYLLRAVGDTAGRGGPTWATWLSPIGWEQQTRAFAQERWWVLLLSAGFAVLALMAGFALAARRDLGAGLLPDRGGPASAGPGLGSTAGLAWRLQRGTLLGWLVGFLLMGSVLGNIATNLGSMLSSEQAQELVRRLGGHNALTDAFLSAELGFAAVIASGYGIQAALRLRSEEESGRAEALLATAVGRIGWTVSHLAVSLLGTAALLLAGGLAVGTSYAVAVDDPGQVGRMLLAAAVQIPATWVLSGIVIALFGVSARAASVGWASLVVFLLLGEIGPLLKLNHWVLDLSPFAHTPRLPGGDVRIAPVLWLLLLVVVLVTTGLWGVRRRDLATA